MVGMGLSLYAGVISYLTLTSSGAPVHADTLLGPILALALLIALVWIVMGVFRNYAILKGIITGNYYRRFDVDAPPDWVERPARTFNNLMQVPQLFYLVCVLMLITQRVDAAQLALAWAFVTMRWLHAIVYMGWNHLPTRFGAFMASFITLITLYVRFALQVGDLL
jgi:hypothetical protein